MQVKSRLGNLLLQKGVINQATLEKALMIQAEDPSGNRQLQDILVYDIGLDHHLVFGALAEFYAFRTANLPLSELDKNRVAHCRELLEHFPEDFRKKLLFKKVLPWEFSSESGTLIVLTANVAEKDVERIPSLTEFKKYEPVYCRLTQLEDIIRSVAPQKNEFLDLLQESVVNMDEATEEESVQENALDEELNKSILVNLFEGSLIEGVRRGASDIHIIPGGRSVVEIHLRIDGRLQLWHRQENTAPEAMASVVKDRTVGADRFERDTAQDGFAQRLIDSHLIRFRVSIVPIVSAEFESRFESVVIRIIDDRNVITGMGQLGFQEQAERDFIRAISKSRGMVLLTGPTGSGKSTTLMAALHHVMDPSLNVLTCEDPVEYVIRGARQLKISFKLSFDLAIRAILRHDPDIVMVGEIRDKETADVAVKLSNTGHLTLSTLHTNDAPSAISRLYKMGIEPFLLASVLNIVIAQRLVRKLCPECRTPIQESTHPLALRLGLTRADIESGVFYDAGPGCKSCNNGYKGRIGITEALYVGPDIRRSILESGEEIDEDKIRAIAEKNGMLSLKSSALDRARNGLTSLAEVAYATSGD